MASFDIFNSKDDILSFQLIESVIDRLSKHDCLATLHFDGYSTITVKIKYTMLQTFTVEDMNSQQAKQNTLNMLYYYLEGVYQGIKYQQGKVVD